MLTWKLVAAESFEKEFKTRYCKQYPFLGLSKEEAICVHTQCDHNWCLFLGLIKMTSRKQSAMRN